MAHENSGSVIACCRAKADIRLAIPFRSAGFGYCSHRDIDFAEKPSWTNPRFDNAEKYPVAARTRQGHKGDAEDRITAKLPALHFYQLSLLVPKAPAGAYDVAAAGRGEALFNGKARCATCHVPPLFTEPGWNLHKAEEIGIDDFQAKRGPDDRYVTAKLRALWDTKKSTRAAFTMTVVLRRSPT